MTAQVLTRVLAVVLAAVWAVTFYGLIDLTTAFDAQVDPDFYLLETGWGLLFTVMVSVPLLALALRPALFAPLAQVTAAAVTVLLVGLVTPALSQVLVGLALLATAGVLGACVPVGGVPEGDARRDENPRAWLLFMALLAAPPAAWFSRSMLDAAREQRYPVDITWGVDHWPMQGAFALTVPLTVAVAAAGWPGWRLCVWSAGVAAAWFGTFSMLFADAPGGLNVRLGAAAVIWAVLLVAVSELVRSHRRRAGEAGSSGNGKAPTS